MSKTPSTHTSRVVRDKAKKRLSEMLGRASDEEFLIMVWAIDALQSPGREHFGAKFLDHPKEVRSAPLTHRHHAYKWMLETLVNQLLTTRKLPPQKNGKTRVLNCTTYASLAACIHLLKKIENAEDGIRLRTLNVLDLMHKLLHRQIEWQRGFFSHSQIYRSMQFYGGPLSLEHFKDSHGLSLNDFFNCGFAVYGLCIDRPGFATKADLTVLNITDSKRELAIGMLSRPLSIARNEATDLRAGFAPVAYKPSLLRNAPVILFGNDNGRARAPLIELILQRITSGLYYDLVGGGPSIWREIGARFEQYCFEFCSAILQTRVDASFRYRHGRLYDSPDILIFHEGKVRIVVECKAKKMSFAAKFSDHPMQEAELGFSEIIKGIVQVWRFAAHCRRDPQIADLHPECVGMVLTLDPWLDVSSYRKRVLEVAGRMADADQNIAAEDRRHIVFASIDDFEGALESASMESFLAAVDATSSVEYDGWSLYTVHDRIAGDTKRHNAYPFSDRIAEINPGWNLAQFLYEQDH